MTVTRRSARDAILAMLAEREPPKTMCPSEVARALAPGDWRPLMPIVRDVARELAKIGMIDVTQKGLRLDPDGEWRGPVRIAHPLGAISARRRR